jgi:hypothetical protein
MANYAKVSNGVVEKVIVAEADFFNSYVDDSPGTWIESSTANTGYTYDSTRDAFVSPKPYPSWTLNESTNNWQPSVAEPDDGKKYRWDEATTNWVEIE